MKEVPIPYIRANQAGIIAFVLLGFIIQLPLIIALLWLIELIGLFGVKANLFVLFSTPFFSRWLDRVPTQSYELTRFNNILTVIFLTLSFVFFEMKWASAGYIAALIVAGAAFLAMCGFSIGGFIFRRLRKA